MAVIDQYLNEIKPGIEAAVDSAFAYMLDGLEEEIGKTAEENVYSYEPTDENERKRRYKIGSPENLNAWTSPMKLYVQNLTEMQEEEGPPEVKVVEEGMAEFNQSKPGPRPFMDEALDEYVDSGRGERELAEALRTAGYTVN